MKSADEAPDKRPSKIILFAVPAVIVGLFIAFSTPQPRTFPDSILLAAFVYLFSVVFLLAGWHGLKFFRSLFHHRRGDSRR